MLQRRARSIWFKCLTDMAWAMARGQERVSAVRVLLLAGIVACVIGLKVVS